jgi:hypothetical protein
MCVPSLSWQNDDLYIENVDQKPVSRNARHVVDVDVSRRALAHVDVRHGPIHLIAHTMYKQTPRRVCQDRLRPSVLSRQAQTVGFVKTGSDRRFCQDRLRPSVLSRQAEDKTTERSGSGLPECRS